ARSWVWSRTEWCSRAPWTAGPCSARSTATSPRERGSSRTPPGRDGVLSDVALLPVPERARKVTPAARSSRHAVAIALALALTTCRVGPKAVVYDLARRVAVAERWASRETVLFGAPAAEPQQAEGFYREAAGPAAEPFLWSKEEAEVAFTWPAVAARACVVDLAPYRGVRDQSAEVRLNGKVVAVLRLNDQRSRYPVPLPAEAQRPGDNRVRFVFRATAPPSP